MWMDLILSLIIFLEHYLVLLRIAILISRLQWVIFFLNFYFFPDLLIMVALAFKDVPFDPLFIPMHFGICFTPEEYKVTGIHYAIGLITYYCRWNPIRLLLIHFTSIAMLTAKDQSSLLVWLLLDNSYILTVLVSVK